MILYRGLGLYGIMGNYGGLCWIMVNYVGIWRIIGYYWEFLVIHFTFRFKSSWMDVSRHSVCISVLYAQVAFVIPIAIVFSIVSHDA